MEFDLSLMYKRCCWCAHSAPCLRESASQQYRSSFICTGAVLFHWRLARKCGAELKDKFFSWSWIRWTFWRESSWCVIQNPSPLLPFISVSPWHHGLFFGYMSDPDLWLRHKKKQAPQSPQRPLVRYVPWRLSVAKVSLISDADGSCNILLVYHTCLV